MSHLNDSISKIQNNPSLSSDLLVYVKYLIVKETPEDKLSSMKEIFSKGILPDLLEFGQRNVPDFANKILNYINNYSKT